MADDWKEYGEETPEQEEQEPAFPMPENNPHYRYAGLYARLTAATLDMMVFLIPSVFVSWLIMKTQPLMPRPPAPDPATATNAEMMQWLIDVGMFEDLLYSMCLHFVLFSIFSGLCWSIWKTTPGKLVMNLRIVSVPDGRPPSLLQLWQRAIGYVMSWLPLSLGFFLAWTNRKKRSLHDLVAGTAVIVNRDPSKNLIVRLWKFSFKYFKILTNKALDKR